MQTQNYFQLFNLPIAFDVDLKSLENIYRKIQSEKHPDRFVIATNSEKLAAMQTATFANEAYLTLKSPALRGAYLLGLQGINAIDEKNTQMPADFLMQQMDWREAIEDAKTAKDMNALENLLLEIKQEAKHLQTELSANFGVKIDLNQAKDNTRKLIFMDKVCADINKIIEHLEA